MRIRPGTYIREINGTRIDPSWPTSSEPTIPESTWHSGVDRPSVEHIDFDAALNPKIFIGCSDVTILLNTFFSKFIIKKKVFKLPDSLFEIGY